SKALSPGFGLGWAVLPPRLMEPVSEELWASTLHPPSLEHLAFADFLARGEFDRHIRRMRASYRRRRDIAIDALRTELPGLRVRGIAAGLHLTLELTGEAEEEAALQSAIAAGINLEAITPHALPDYCGPRGLLMGFGAIPEPTVSHAISALAVALSTDRDQDGDAGRVSGAARF
ncbi:MAG TPA: hypothetical protein VKR22_09070, partial [Acidimicrobiales bacterium]|nr:hypothetical protein [Acidimicrobiales bacterium]